MSVTTNAELLYCIDFDSIFKKIESTERYELHDPKTGLKTEKFQEENVSYYIHKYTGEKFQDCRNKFEKYLHRIESGFKDDEYVIGILIKQLGSDSEHAMISQEQIDRTKKEFDEKIFQRLLNCSSCDPKLCLNLIHHF